MPVATRPSAFCLLPSAFCLLPSAFCLLPSAFRFLPSVTIGLLPIIRLRWRVKDETRMWKLASFESGGNDVYSLGHDPFFVLLKTPRLECRAICLRSREVHRRGREEALCS